MNLFYFSILSGEAVIVVEDYCDFLADFQSKSQTLANNDMTFEENDNAVTPGFHNEFFMKTKREKPN